MFKSLFSKFSKSKEIDPIDLSGLNTDMHSHLIPGIDDGVRGMEFVYKVIESGQSNQKWLAI